MATQGLQWAQLIGNLTAGAAQRQQQGQQFAQTLDLDKQHEQLQQQQEDRQKQQQYDEELSHALSQGAKYVGPGGMVQETSYDQQGNPQTIHRPVNENRFVAKYKNPVSGDTVQLEWPNEQEQQLSNAINNARGMGPVNAANAGATSQAQALGTGMGQAQVRNATAVPASSMLTPEGQLQADAPITPQEGVGMARATVAPTIRAKTQKEIQDEKDAAAAQRTQLRTQAQADLQTVKDQSAATRQQQTLDYRDRWEKARTSLSANTQANLNNRVLMQQLDENQKAHGLLNDQAYKETQKQLDAQALLDPKAGTQDGEEFTNPFTGKKATMNMAQRTVLQSALGASQAQVADLKSRAGQIEQRYGLNGQPAQGGGGQAVGGGAPAAPAAKPAAPAAAPASKYKAGDTVKLKTGQTVTIKQIKPDGTFTY